MTPEEVRIAGWFPAVQFPPAAILAGMDDTYNCVAWAAGDVANWWEPGGGKKTWWPAGCTDRYTVAAHIEAFEGLGYAVRDTDEPIPGVEEVAIMTNDISQIHMMKRDSSGNWTSKLGEWELISHGLNDLVGHQYGRIVAFMSRSAGINPPPAG